MLRIPSLVCYSAVVHAELNAIYASRMHSDQKRRKSPCGFSFFFVWIPVSDVCSAYQVLFATRRAHSPSLTQYTLRVCTPTKKRRTVRICFCSSKSGSHSPLEDLKFSLTTASEFLRADTWSVFFCCIAKTCCIVFAIQQKDTSLRRNPS